MNGRGCASGAVLVGSSCCSVADSRIAASPAAAAAAAAAGSALCSRRYCWSATGQLRVSAGKRKDLNFCFLVRERILLLLI